MSAGVAMVDVSHVLRVVAAAAPRVRGGAALGAGRQSGLRSPELAGEVSSGGRHPGEDTRHLELATGFRESKLNRCSNE